jgi:omega-6 fatty acid desaturase (delta-12 desaturase)
MSVVLYSLICPYLLGVPAFEMWFSMYVVELIGALIFHLEHSVNNTYRERTINWDPMRASLEGSTYLHIPLILKPFSNGVEYHHIHHINTNVPSYRLE